MSYTNADLVRAHLGTSYPGRDRIFDRTVTLAANDYSVFHDTAVDEGTVLVKANLSQKLNRIDLTFALGRALISPHPLVAGSVVIASDSSLGHLFTENADFIVSYPTGEVTVLEDSALGESQTVSVWFESYTLFAPGVDYVVDSQRAAIKRLGNGALGAGQTVVVDFTPRERQLSDALIAMAIAEANAMIEHEVDPSAEFGADPTLQAAATCLALESLCRASAMQELRRNFANDRIAATWMSLAEQLSAHSSELIRAFRKPFIGPIAAAKT